MESQTFRPQNQVSDKEAIRQSVLDYIAGWYEGDAERMRRCLHNGLVVQGIERELVSGKEILNHFTYEHLSAETQDVLEAHLFTSERRYDITVLDIYGDIATARADSSEWVDYLHLARLNGRWVIASAVHTAKPARG